VYQLAPLYNPAKPNDPMHPFKMSKFDGKISQQIAFADSAYLYYQESGSYPNFQYDNFTLLQESALSCGPPMNWEQTFHFRHTGRRVHYVTLGGNVGSSNKGQAINYPSPTYDDLNKARQRFAVFFYGTDDGQVDLEDQKNNQ
jgi:hypothetical protein